MQSHMRKEEEAIWAKLAAAEGAETGRKKRKENSNPSSIFFGFLERKKERRER